MSSLLTEIIDGLSESRGLEFNEWIAKALNFLFLKSKVIEETQSESDVIAEALLAVDPYYIVVEGQAVLDHNEVSYDKLGQLRGNSSSYRDERRLKIFKNAYMLVVGRPKFSKDAKIRAKPDVVLISVKNLILLLQFHKIIRFSQDDLETLFKEDETRFWGEITKNKLANFLRTPFIRRMDITALVLLSLGATLKKREWMPFQQVIGIAKTYDRFLRIGVENEDITNAIMDLQSGLVRLIERRNDDIRLQSYPIENIGSLLPSGTSILRRLHVFSERLRNLEKIKKD